MSFTEQPPTSWGASRRPPIKLDFTIEYGSIGLPPEISKRAVRAVASRADDATDARALLDALGLTIAPTATGGAA